MAPALLVGGKGSEGGRARARDLRGGEEVGRRAEIQIRSAARIKKRTV
jgi:hypothetical protein